MPVRHLTLDREELDRCRELVRYFPGYRGYRLKELRKREDKRLRAEVSRMLVSGASRLEAVQKEAFLSDQRSAAVSLAESRRRLSEMAESMRSPSSGHSRFFEDDDISAARLKNLMDADSEIFRLADSIVKCVSKLEQFDLPADEREFRSQYLVDFIDRLSLAYDSRHGLLSACG